MLSASLCGSCNLCSDNSIVILPEGKVRADLHNHLRTFSTMKNFNGYIDCTLNFLGKGGILGVVNFSDARYEEFVSLKGYERVKVGNGNAYYVPKKDILIVKGQEIETDDGHLLAIGIPCEKHISDHRSIEDTIKETKDFGGLTIIDHPFYLDGILNESENFKFLREVDAMEIWNGSANLYIKGKTPKDSNKIALESFKKLKKDLPNLGVLVSSDGHTMSEIGSSYMLVDKPDFSTSESLVTSLRNSMRNLNVETDIFCGEDYFFSAWHAGMLVIHRGLLKISQGKIDLNRRKSFESPSRNVRKYLQGKS